MSEESKIEVFEFHGRTAQQRGWDCLICRTLGDALSYAESAMEDAEEDEEVTVIFRRYTQAQLDELVQP